MARQFPVEFNIRAGGIQHLAGGSAAGGNSAAGVTGEGSAAARDVGTLMVDLYGQPGDLSAALEYLRRQGVMVEEGSAAHLNCKEEFL